METSILIIYTGGTIGMMKDQETGVLKPFNFDHLYTYIPALKNFNYQLDFVCFDPLIDSSNMAPEHWIRLTEIVHENYEKYDGFVILHGSDTMSFTASALSFMLENLNKPVIITGSQLPLGELRTDGRENFITSVEIAAAKMDDTPIVPEVTIFFENKLYRGNRTFKFNAENFNAFVSGNYPVLANAGIYLKYHHDLILKPNFKKLKIHTKLSDEVALLKLFPGMSRTYIHSILSAQPLRAVVMESFGSGNATTANWFLEKIENAINQGLIVVNTTQCLAGSVDMEKYETGKKLSDIGVISGKDMTSAAALAKLMVLLGEYSDNETVIKKFQKPWCGEMSV
ncbi:MAG: asparaginase [Bacteroidales bacterium]|nr:asparaginase [Bacteroidales bacterium]